MSILSRGSLAVLCALAAGGCARRQKPVEPPAPVSTPVESPAAPTPQTVAAPSGPGSVDSSVVREYRGAYNRGWEASWFAPCNAPFDDALWWVTLTDQALRQRDSLMKTLQRPIGEALAVRWRGSISARMPAGMMGRGTRYMLVTEVLDVRPLTPGAECLPLGRASY